MSRKGIFLVLYLTAVVSTFGYEVGVANKYSFSTTTTVDELCRGEDEPQLVGERLSGSVYLTAVWQNPQKPTQLLIKTEVSDVKLAHSKKSSFVEHTSALSDLPSEASFILWEKGSVSTVWDSPKDHHSLRNLKRGITSLLQVQKKNQDEREVDVAGNCQTVYEINGENIRKRKSNCIHSQFDESLSQPYGVRSLSTQHLLSSDCELLKDDVIASCKAFEYIKAYGNVWKKPTLCINAKTELAFEGTSKGTNYFRGKDLESVIGELKKSYTDLQKGTLEVSYITQEPEQKSKIADSIKKHQDSLENKNLAKLKSSLAFYKLLPSFRSATKEAIVKLLQNKKFKTVQGQILDLIAASSNENSLRAAFEYFEDTTSYDEMLERFLISLSVIPKTKAYVFREIKSFLESKKRHEKIQATLVSTLGAVLRTYSKQQKVAESQVIEEYATYLEKKLKECSEKSCEQSYLRGLKNAAFPRSAYILLEYALKGGKSALEAIQAIRNIEVHLLPDKLQDKLLKVFLQIGNNQDRSTRSIAADILLDMNPSPDILKGMLSTLSDQEDEEFATFLASKIFRKATLDRELESKILNLLPEKHISYYYSMAQKGSSSIFSKPLIDSEELNVTYSLQLEMLAGNLLKRSIFDVNFEQPETSNLLTVGMFAEGIASFAGGEDEEGVEPQAGMELTLLGSALRPYVFFTGTSELMGHAWSGTASTLTPALQGIFLFSDDERIIVLHNGMISKIQLRGVLSADLSASVQISLWGRTSQSQVKNAAALLMRSAATVESGFSTLQGTTQYSGQSAIDFSSDLDFSASPFKLCSQMTHPDIALKYDLHRSITIPGTKYSLKRTKRRKRYIPSKSFALHEKNNEQCRILN